MPEVTTTEDLNKSIADEWEETIRLSQESLQLSKEAEEESKSALRWGIVSLLVATLALVLQLADKLGYLS